MVGSIRACGMTERVGASQSLWSEAARRFGGDTKALLACALIALIALIAIVGPLFSPYGYAALDWHHLAVPPELRSGHWLGTDRLGRDLFVRTL